jgi:hypothetical protein
MGPSSTVAFPARSVSGTILIACGGGAMQTFEWVAVVVAVVILLIALNDFGGARWARRALLRKPPQDPREHARIRARGSDVPKDIGTTGGG